MNRVPVAAVKNIKIAVVKTEKENEMIELDEIKQALPGVKANLKEAGESL